MIENSLLNAFLSLGVIVLALGAALFFLKRISKKRKNGADIVNLNVISKLSLQAKSHLFVVKAGDKTLLIGVSDHNISTLADLTEDTEQNKAIKRSLDVKDKVSLSQNFNSIVKKENKVDESLSFKSFLKSAFSKQN